MSPHCLLTWAILGTLAANWKNLLSSSLHLLVAWAYFSQEYVQPGLLKIHPSQIWKQNKLFGFIMVQDWLTEGRLIELVPSVCVSSCQQAAWACVNLPSHKYCVKLQWADFGKSWEFWKAGRRMALCMCICVKKLFDFKPGIPEHFSHHFRHLVPTLKLSARVGLDSCPCFLLLLIFCGWIGVCPF